MRSMQYGPRASKDGANNLVFSELFMTAYKNNLDVSNAEPGTKFQFFNGPHGGGKKLVVVRVDSDLGPRDTFVVTAKEQ